MTPAAQMAEKLQCSELAAREICKEALALARCFVEVYDVYDLTHVLAAKRAIRKALFEYQPSKSAQGGGKVQADKQAAERLSRYRRALPRPAIKLFDCAQAAKNGEAKFRTALSLANAQNHLGFDEALSATLLALHDARQLSSPEKVGDGRLAYESLCRDYALLRDLGIG